MVTPAPSFAVTTPVVLELVQFTVIVPEQVLLPTGIVQVVGLTLISPDLTGGSVITAV